MTSTGCAAGAAGCTPPSARRGPGRGSWDTAPYAEFGITGRTRRSWVQSSWATTLNGHGTSGSLDRCPRRSGGRCGLRTATNSSADWSGSKKLTRPFCWALTRSRRNWSRSRHRSTTSGCTSTAVKISSMPCCAPGQRRCGRDMGQPGAKSSGNRAWARVVRTQRSLLRLGRSNDADARPSPIAIGWRCVDSPVGSTHRLGRPRCSPPPRWRSPPPGRVRSPPATVSTWHRTAQPGPRLPCPAPENSLSCPVLSGFGQSHTRHNPHRCGPDPGLVQRRGRRPRTGSSRCILRVFFRCIPGVGLGAVQRSCWSTYSRGAQGGPDKGQVPCSRRLSPVLTRRFTGPLSTDERPGDRAERDGRPSR
jgi:hypothetical protein